MAAGRCKSAATNSGLRPRSLIMRASLPQVVVLPEPCRPHIISTVTSGLQMQRVIDRAHQVDQFLMDDADDLLAGIERREHLFADGLLGDAGHEVLDDRVADVGLEQRLLRPGASPSRMFASVSFPLPRSVLSAEDRPSCRDSNMAGPQFVKRSERGRPSASPCPASLYRCRMANDWRIASPKETHILANLAGGCKSGR